MVQLQRHDDVLNEEFLMEIMEHNKQIEEATNIRVRLHNYTINHTNEVLN